MTTYNTGNPVPSGNPFDRFDNSQTFDEVVNSQEYEAETRLGEKVKTLKWMQDAALAIPAIEAAARAEGFAEDAEGSATEAVAQVVIAETQAQRSQMYAEAALTNGGIKKTTAEGIASGLPFFWLLAPDTDKALLLYENVGGVAVNTGESMASSDLVIALSNGKFTNLGLTFRKLPPESGYTYAVSDLDDRSPMLFGLDGSVIIHKLVAAFADGSITKQMIDPLISNLFATAWPIESGWAFSLPDLDGKIPFGITDDGKVKGNFDIDIPDLSGVEYLLPLKNLWFIGDSLTDNAPWQTLLAALVSERSMVQTAMGGQTGDQLSAKAGAQSTLLTVQNNVIPATGAVAVTDITVRLLSTPAYNSVTFTMKGWLRGVYGTLTCASNAGGDLLDEYSFTRDVAGTVVYCPSRTPFKPDLAGKDFWTPIVWVGRNNLTYPEDVKGNIEAIVNVQKTAQKRFLIMTPPLGGTQVSGQSTTEGVGSVFYNNCRSVEDWATRKYGDRVLNMRELLMQFGDGSADDLDDIAKGVVPRSLRADTLHLNAKGNGHVADLLAYEINRRNW